MEGDKKRAYVTKKEFGQRLGRIRVSKGISARCMSMSLKLNPNYINSIELGKTYPSMEVFFAICDYLEIKPVEIMGENNSREKALNDIIVLLDKVPFECLKSILNIIKAIAIN